MPGRQSGRDVLGRGVIFRRKSGARTAVLVLAGPRLSHFRSNGPLTTHSPINAALVHFALSPVPLGRGEAMFEGLDLLPSATHVVLGRKESE
jgi:hypothetical protein